jgi:hypothetical protein
VRIIVALISLLFVVSAHARIYLDQSRGKAIVYFIQGERVNASVCENVTELELLNILDDAMKFKCRRLSTEGFSQAMVAARLEVLKKKIFESMKLDAEPRAITPQKKAIENLTAVQIFNTWSLDAKDASIEKVKASKDLDSEIAQFLILTGAAN